MDDLTRRVEALERKREKDRDELVTLKTAVETSEKHLMLKFKQIDERMNKSDEKLDKLLDQIGKVNTAVQELNTTGAVSDSKITFNQKMIFGFVSLVASGLLLFLGSLWGAGQGVVS